MAPTRKTRACARRRHAPARARTRAPGGVAARGSPAGRGSLLAGGLPRLPVLDQRQRDVLGLALVAAGVFMGFVLYGGWNGGRAGHGLAVALGWTLGRARVLAPVTLVIGGGALLLRPVLPALGRCAPARCACSRAVTLALAAGMLGLSSGAGAGRAGLDSAHLQSHGGIAGEALYQLAHRLVQDVGVDILVVFLLLAGVILLTGASIASVIRATGTGVARHHPHGARRREREPRRAARGARTLRRRAPTSSTLAEPPEPTPRELIVRATHVEAPPHDWRDAEESPLGARARGGGPALAGRRGAGRRATRTRARRSDVAGVAHADAGAGLADS